jgi:glutamate racemase
LEQIAQFFFPSNLYFFLSAPICIFLSAIICVIAERREAFMRTDIAIFDSGVGGLTVTKEIIRVLPKKNIVYFGDMARLPYGTKSPAAVTRFARQNIRFLNRFKPKLLVVACNTVTAVCLDKLKKSSKIPVVGVLGPACKTAVLNTRNKKIGIIGTEATIASRSYENFIKRKSPAIKTYSKACPLLVPLVEEIWLEDKITRAVIKRYLEPLFSKNVDTIILGCTHYPLLYSVFKSVVGRNITLIDSATETAKEVKKKINRFDIDAKTRLKNKVERQYFVSDAPQRLKKIGKRCLKQDFEVEVVDIEKY